MIWKIVREEELEAATLDAARHVINRPKEALRLSRQLVRASTSEILDRMDQEMRIFVERLKSDEAKALYKAFLEKRR